MAAVELELDELEPGREERLVGPAEFVRRLVRERRRARVAQPLLRVPADPDLAARRMTWAAELLKRESVAFLVRAGGWRRRLVVVGERRREGRVWEPGVWERLQVRFGPAPLLLLEAAMRQPGALPAAGPELQGLWREPTRGGTGDLLALHLIVDALLQDGAGGAEVRAGGGRPDAQRRELQTAVEDLLRALGGPGRQVTLARADGGVLAAAGDPQLSPAANAGELLARAAEGAPHTWIDLGPWQRTLRLLARRWPAQGLGLLAVVGGTRRSLDLDGGGLRAALDALERRLPADEEAAGAGERELLLVSPLTLLFRPGALGGLEPGPAREALTPLFVGDRPALLTWLDEALARAWLREETRRQALPPNRITAAWSAAGAGLDAVCSAAALAERPDALRPLVRFYDRFLVLHGTRVPVVQAVQSRAEALDRASDRETLRRAAASLFGPGRRITAAGERALGRAFVDRTEPERAFLVDYHETWRQIGPEIEAIRRELAGEVG